MPQIRGNQIADYTITGDDIMTGSISSDKFSAPVGEKLNFGTYHSWSNSEGITSTTRTAFITKLTISTGNIPTGTYRLAWTYAWLYSSTSKNFVARIILDDITTIMTHVEEPKESDDDQRIPAAGFYFSELEAGEHEYKLQFKTSQENKEADIMNCRLEFYRIG